LRKKRPTRWLGSSPQGADGSGDDPVAQGIDPRSGMQERSGHGSVAELATEQVR